MPTTATSAPVCMCLSTTGSSAAARFGSTRCSTPLTYVNDVVGSPDRARCERSGAHRLLAVLFDRGGRGQTTRTPPRGSRHLFLALVSEPCQSRYRIIEWLA